MSCCEKTDCMQLWSRVSENTVMSWFDEQIRARKESDEAGFSEANRSLGNIINGKHFGVHRRETTGDPISDILLYFGLKAQPVPAEARELNDRLEFLLRPYGIMRRTVCLEKGWHRDASGPMLAFLKKDESPVALIPGILRGYEYFDPDEHRWIKIDTAGEELFCSEATVFYRPLPIKSLSFKDVTRFLFDSHTTTDRLLIFLFLGISTLIQTLVPRVNKVVFSTLIFSDSMKLFWSVAVFLISLTLSSVIFKTLHQMILNRITNRTSASLEAALVMRLLALPAQFYRENSAGMLNNRMYRCRDFSMSFNRLLYSSLLITLFSLVYIIQIFVYAPGVAPAAVITILLQIVIYVSSSILHSRHRQKQLELENRESNLSYSSIYGMQKVKLVGAEKRVYGQWAGAYGKMADALFNQPLFLVIAPALGAATALVGQIAIYWSAIQTKVSLSDYYAFSSAYGMVSGAVAGLATLAASISQIRPLYDQLRPILEAVPEISPAKKVVSNVKGKIQLEDVCFRYTPHMANVVDHLNLEIHPGEYLAIVGRTGCGKSTILRLLLGFETPDSGVITYDGRDISTLDLRSLRRSIGVVLQDGKLFQGDIFSNITISAPWLSEEDAWEAARMAGLEDDIKNMPMGMHTMINANSGGVSGGQRQRIMIARAIASRPKILMFDEATSALDNVTQKIVSDSLEKLHCTRIVIAHRLSTIRQCDRIIMMDGGHIVEDGTYDELIKKGGAFADMVARQQVSYNPED